MILAHETCYTAYLDAIHFKRVLNFGEGQPPTGSDEQSRKGRLCHRTGPRRWKGLIRHRNKIAVFNRSGDDIFSGSTRELGNAVKDACEAMTKAKE